jgi:signal transduction histidine kinase
MLASLLFSTGAFITGTMLTQERLMAQQSAEQIALVQQTLRERADIIQVAASLLAHDPLVAANLSEAGPAALDTLNSRAVVVRERFDLDLVQIFNAAGAARANLVLSSLYRQSSLLPLLESDGLTTVAVGQQLLLLGRAALPEAGGFIVTGVNLDTELHRIVDEEHLPAVLGLRLDETRVGTSDTLSFDLPNGRHETQYIRRSETQLGGRTLDLLVARDTADMARVIDAGLWTIVGSNVLTLLLLVILATVLLRSMIKPLGQLASAATALANGRMDQPSDLDQLLGSGDAATKDEIGLLALAFSRMIDELRQVYQNLEDKVETRTHQLAAAAEVARAASTSLDAQVVLKSAVELMDERSGYFCIAVYTRNCVPETLVLSASAGLAAETLRRERASIAEGPTSLVGIAAMTRRRSIVQGASSPHPDGRLLPDAVAEAAIPLVSGDALIGVLDVSSRHESCFSPEEIAVLQLVADQLAIALQNARLYDAVQQELAERTRAERALRESEMQLRQAQKMEAVGRLAGGIAHDFNNLLTVIIGYTHMLLRSVDAQNPMQADLERIRRSADRAAGLTRQLLAFSRRQVLQPSVLDLNEVVADMDDMLRRLLGEDIHLKTILNRADRLNLLADAGQIEQVIMNLAVNARDAMPEGGQLIIETRPAIIDSAYVEHHVTARPGSYVLLAMTDTGTGMDQETMARVFEPFFTTKQHGTGLGLSTVYGIVEQSGGHINIYSEPGRGTTVKVYLPRTEEASAPEHRTPVGAAMPHGSGLVLLVEDEEMVREMALAALLESGYTVFTARHAEEALGVAQKYARRIQLLVTDVILPGMNGVELADRLTASLPDLKVLYMSGYTDNAIIHQGVLQPGFAFLQKPFTPEALARRVHGLLDGNHHQTGA